MLRLIGMTQFRTHYLSFTRFENINIYPVMVLFFIGSVTCVGLYLIQLRLFAGAFNSLFFFKTKSISFLCSKRARLFVRINFYSYVMKIFNFEIGLLYYSMSFKNEIAWISFLIECISSCSTLLLSPEKKKNISFPYQMSTSFLVKLAFFVPWDTFIFTHIPQVKILNICGSLYFRIF